MEEYNDNQQITEFENQEPQRPTGLTIACVLSFINAGWQFLMNFIMFAVYNMMKTMTNDDTYIELMEKYGVNVDDMETAMSSTFAVNRSYYLLTALLYIGSFLGVLYMWRMQKKGFHYYSIAQILILIVAMLMFYSVTATSPVSSIILTAIFIGIYFIYYRKVMK